MRKVSDEGTSGEGSASTTSAANADVAHVQVENIRSKVRASRKPRRCCFLIKNSVLCRRRYDFVSFGWLLGVLFVLPVFGVILDLILYETPHGVHPTGFLVVAVISVVLSLLHLVFQALWNGRLRTVWELVFHIMFYALLCAFIETRASSTPTGNNINRWLMIRFGIDGDNYANIHDYDSFWYYMQHEFVEAYDTPLSTKLGASEFGFNDENILHLGPVRIRQLRVKAGTCDAGWRARIDQFGLDSCYGAFNVFNEDRGDFTDDGGTTWDWTETKIQTIAGRTVSSAAYLVGPEQNVYHDHGYRAYFYGGDYSSWNSTLNTMRLNNWVGIPTRAIIIESIWFFPQSGIWASLGFIFDFHPDGTVTPLLEPQVKVGNFGTEKYVSGGAISDLEELIWVLVGFAFSMLLVEVLDIIQFESVDDMLSYLTLFKVFDWVNIIGVFVSYGILVWSFLYYPKAELYFDSANNRNNFIPWQTVAQAWVDTRRVMAFSTFVSILRFLRFLSLIPKVGVMERTLTHAKWELLAFTTVFIVVVLAFAQAFHVIFSVKLGMFSSYFTSLLSSFGALLGTLDVQDLTSVDPILGPVLFISFIFLNLFILLNIFITITNNSYSAVSEMAEEEAVLSRGAQEHSCFWEKSFYHLGIFNLFQEHKVTRKKKVRTSVVGTAVLATQRLRRNMSLSSMRGVSETLPEVLADVKPSTEALQEELDSIRSEITKVKREKSKLRSFIKKLESLATNVDFEADDG